MKWLRTLKKGSAFLLVLTMLISLTPAGFGDKEDVTDAPEFAENEVIDIGNSDQNTDTDPEFIPGSIEEQESKEEPEAIGESETEAEPETNEKPENKEDPEAAEEPITTEEPETAAEPIITEEPETGAEPEANEEPESKEEPEAAEEPMTSEEPEAAEEPGTIEEPEAGAEPETHEEPENKEDPESREEPETHEEPSIESEDEPEENGESLPASFSWTIDIQKIDALSGCISLSWAAQIDLPEAEADCIVYTRIFRKEDDSEYVQLKPEKNKVEIEPESFSLQGTGTINESFSDYAVSANHIYQYKIDYCFENNGQYICSNAIETEPLTVTGSIPTDSEESVSNESEESFRDETEDNGLESNAPQSSPVSMSAPSISDWEISNLGELKVEIYDDKNTLRNDISGYEWLLDGNVILSTGKLTEDSQYTDLAYEYIDISEDDWERVCCYGTITISNLEFDGETHSLKVRAFANVNGTKYTGPASTACSITFPTFTFPECSLICTGGINYFFWEADPTDCYDTDVTIYYKAQGDSSYKSFNLYPDDLESYNGGFRYRLPGNVGKYTAYYASRHWDWAYDFYYTHQSKNFTYYVGPKAPSIKRIEMTDGAAKLLFTQSEKSLPKNSGFEVSITDNTLQDIPAVAGQTSFSIPVTVTHGKTVTAKVRGYTVLDGKKRYGAYATKKIYIPKMPTGMKISDQYDDYRLDFKGDAKAKYLVYIKHPADKSYSKLSDDWYNSSSIWLGIERQYHIGVNKVYLKVSNENGTFLAKTSTVSFTVKPYDPDYLSFRTLEGTKLNVCLTDYSNIGDDSVYADGAEIYLNGTKVKTIKYKKGQDYYDFTVSLKGLNGKAVTLKARAYKTVNGKKYYSSWRQESYVGYPSFNYQLYGMGVKVTWSPKAYGAQYYDVYLESTSSTKPVVYAKKLKASSGAVLSSKKLVKGNSYRVRVVGWSTVDGKRVENYSYDWLTFRVTQPDTTISNTRKTIILSWEKIPGVNGIEIQRSLAYDTGYRTVATLKGNAVSYTDKNVVKGNTYYYRARAYCVNSSGTRIYSDYSWPMSANIDTPANTTLTISHTMKALTLKWKKVDCDGYYLYRYSENEPAILLAKLDKNATSFVNKNTGANKVKSNTVYYYWIAPYFKANDWNRTSGSNTVADWLRPATPKGLKAKAKDSTSATVTWEAVDGAKYYEVWMRTNNDPEGSEVKVAKVTSTKATITKLKKGNTYYFIVRAVNGKAVGDFSKACKYQAK